MGTVELNDIAVNYSRRGSGQPVVLLHGLAEDHQSWDAVATHLSDFEVYALDVRGHGRTTAGGGTGTLSQLSEDLSTFLATVTGPATVIGYSLGGTIGLGAAVASHALIDHLIVAATSSVVGAAAAEFFEGRIAQLASGDMEGFAAGLRSDTANQIVSEADLDSVTARRLTAVGDGRGYINCARAMIGIRSEPLQPLLGQIRLPVDVIGASDDLFCPRRASDMIVDSIDDCTYHEIAGAGHLISVDQPDVYGELLARLVAERGAR